MFKFHVFFYPIDLGDLGDLEWGSPLWVLSFEPLMEILGCLSERTDHVEGATCGTAHHPLCPGVRPSSEVVSLGSV